MCVCKRAARTSVYKRKSAEVWTGKGNAQPVVQTTVLHITVKKGAPQLCSLALCYLCITMADEVIASEEIHGLEVSVCGCSALLLLGLP